jgi:hypothetical protein
MVRINLLRKPVLRIVAQNNDRAGLVSFHRMSLAAVRDLCEVNPVWRMHIKSACTAPVGWEVVVERMQAR